MYLSRVLTSKKLESMVTIFYKNPITEGGQNYIYAIGEAIVEQHGDKGSCVMGMKLLWKGMTCAYQIAQGSLTNEYFFNAVIDGFEERGFDRNDFTIDFGKLD
jgi:hypothetical protein